MRYKFSSSAMERIIECISDRNNYSARIVKVTGITNNTVVGVVKHIERIGIVHRKKKDGLREIAIELTEKGKRIQGLIKELRSYDGR